MNRSFSLVICLLVVASLVLPGCGGASAPGGGKCSQGVCVKLQVAEPIRPDEPVTVTITVSAEKDTPKLGMSLYFGGAPAVVMEGPQDWFVDVEANQPISFTRRIRFLREGLFRVNASANTPGLRAEDSVNIRITGMGGTVNPTPEIGPGTPAPALPVVPETPPTIRTPPATPLEPSRQVTPTSARR